MNLSVALSATIDNTGGPDAGGVEGGNGRQNIGHEYRTKNKVCDRALSVPERKDLLSRFAVPSAFSGSPVGDGLYLVTNSFGIPGGFVRTDFSDDGLSVANRTTAVHVFVGTIERNFEVSDGVTYSLTHGYGNAGNGTIGRFRDASNTRFGPGIFNGLDARAARYADKKFPGCKK